MAASKRNSSGASAVASSSSIPLSHYNDKGQREHWPVVVYRHQSHRGWEIYSNPDKQESTTTAGGASSGKNKGSSSSNGAKSSGKGGGNANINNGGGVGGGTGKASHRAMEELTVAPRMGCIEVRQMRLRIKLFEQNTPWDSNQPPRRSSCGISARPSNKGENNDEGCGPEMVEGGAKNVPSSRDGCESSDYPASDGWNNNALVVRRRNTLLVTTRRGVGAVMFRFKSSQDCIDFCDRLVFLNREYFMQRTSSLSSGDELDTTPPYNERDRSHEEENEYVNGMDKRELHHDNMLSLKRRKLSMLGDQQVNGSYYNNKNKQTNGEDEAIGQNNNNMHETEMASGLTHDTQQYHRREELMSYIVKLAHSEEFRGFVDELERGLELAPDTAEIHAALGF